MENFPVSSNEKVSFRDVKENVLGRIRNKTWAPGTIIPGEVELAVNSAVTRHGEPRDA